MVNQVSVPKVQTTDRNINQLQQNIITAVNQLQQQINNITGFSGTITTAKLTSMGTQGSMTFVNGLLTAQTQAT